jgi:transposase
VNLAMSPFMARAPAGERARFKRPAARGTNVSVVGALSADGILAFGARDGAYDGPRFMAFINEKLVPQLREGDVVLMDNVRFHLIAEVAAAIEATGASVMYLPPYSPELNPIEEAWSLFKNAMRRAAARDLSSLIDALVRSMESITAEVASAFIKHAGYAAQLS